MPTAWGDRRKRRSKRKKRTSAINGTAASVDRGSTIVRRREEDEDEQEERDAKKRSLGSPEQPEEEEEEAVSSAPSSPICEPYIPDDEEYSVELYEAFEPLQQKFEEKIDRQMQMPTLDNFVPTSCLATDPHLLPVRQRGTKAVLSAAKFLIGLSSSIGGKPLLRCSGFWIDWDEEGKTGTVLTTAHLIRSNHKEYDEWLGQNEYDPNAKVMVHLLDETILEACLLYYQAHYDIALFRVMVDRPVPLPSFNDEVQSAQDVFMLGRDGNLDIRITHGRVQHLNPDLFQRYHFMFCSGTDGNNEDDDGGLVIDLDGKLVGMVSISSQGSFIPSSILLKCMDLWRRFGRIHRPHLGLKFNAIKLLDPVYIEKIWRKYNIDDGLIVNEVANGSNAEMLGIRRGDIISSFNGEQISTTTELENLLLEICKDFDTENQSNAKVDVVINVFSSRKSRWREFHLTANVSDHGEVVARDLLS